VIDAYAFIEAGAVVNRNVKACALMAGVPARQIGWMSAYGEILDLPLTGNGKAICPDDQSPYELIAGTIKKK
jgi:UDP-2-acetamido-3-amino-2,3-dideoxy-glucuronate N-acetyltransferase